MAVGRAKKKQALVLEYQEYVEHIVTALMRAMSLPADSFDDFVSAGYLGLVEAAERFDPKSGSEFRNFAYLRIRGAVIDSIRACSDLSPSAYRFARALQAAQDMREEMIHAGKPADDAESQDGLNSLGKVLSYAAKGALAYRLSITDAEEELTASATPERDPETALLAKEDAGRFRELVKKLPPKERGIIENYYFHGKSFKEIRDEDKTMSKSWVSRLHSRALDMLKERYLEMRDETIP